ncbi:MAG: DUF177 domain-containing protein [Chloroflexi bacterium]|nr:DUF177 domain-containing protein [Chloroflexota bacterium]
MPTPRKPFRINVGFIIHEEVGFATEIPFELEKAKLEDFELRNLLGSVSIGRTPQGLVVQGKFSADTKLECVRCLRQFWRPLVWEITELYAFNKKNVSESGLLLPDDAHIDLAPLLREYALLEVPINPIHAPECKGLCIECGQDLNIKDCGHSQHDEDSPFSVLKKLL